MIPKLEFDSDLLRVINDLKSLIDSFSPKARKYLIAEVQLVLADLTSAKAQSVSTTPDHSGSDNPADCDHAGSAEN